MKTRDIGNFGEDIAKAYLEKKGYTLIDRNYSSSFGEIDLIMNKGEVLVFIEVKLRKNSDFGRPRDFVTSSKQKKILKTALTYMSKKQLQELQPRFDVVEILTDNNYIEHIENAFP
ncbi:MAG: YraN family protein [Lagierella massiliensis]|nr:YraN family protein [Lagierella massiliensis]